MKRRTGSKRTHWSWREGTVDPAEEHFEIRYGSARDSDWTAWVSLARVGAPLRRVFPVQFLVDRNDSANALMVQSVVRELDFYLVEKGESDPWRYAQYHSSASSNLYSDVHWLFHGKAKRGTV